jgi:hypothetical protein
MAQLTVSPQRKTLIAMKVESTYATDVFAGTYTTADVIPAYNIQPDTNLEEIQNLMASGDIGRLPSVIGIENGRVSFTTWLRGTGVAYSSSIKPEVDRALRGCALIGTGSFGAGTESWTYQPGTPESYTIYVVNVNGRTLKLVGCFGSCQIAQRAGGQVIGTFTFQGKIGGVSDVTYVAATVSGTPQYPTTKANPFNIGAGPYAPRIANIGLDLGNALTGVPTVGDGTGLAGFFISDRNPRVQIDPEIDTVANFDWLTAYRNGTLNKLTWAAGATQYNRVKFNVAPAAAARAQIVNNGFGTRDQMVSAPTTFLATINAGSDDLSIVFD